MPDSSTTQPNYEAVAALSAEDQRRLVHEGDAQERVWAAWALGLRLGPTTAGIVRDALHHEPPAGTRMHFAAILAGLGEREIVTALATGDPSERVRATACQYLVKTSPVPDPDLASLLSDRLEVEGSEVRQGILVESPGRLGPISSRALARCAGDSDARVRELAVSELERTVSAAEAAVLLASLLPSEEDPELRRRLVQAMLASGEPRRVLDAALVSAPAQAQALLRLLRDRDCRFAWETLRPLADRSSAAIDCGVLGLIDDLADPSAVRWIAAGIARALRLPRPRRREEFREQEPYRAFQDSAMTSLRENVDAWRLDAAADEDLRLILRHLEAELRYLLDLQQDEDQLDDDDDFDYDAEVRELERQCNAIRRRLGSSPLQDRE